MTIVGSPVDSKLAGDLGLGNPELLHQLRDSIGTLDDVQVYDLVLDEAQIAFLIANPGQPLVPVGEIDTDLDGLTDDAEANEHNTDPLVADTDGDGLNDGKEVNDTKTDPLLADTDGDGGTDGAESIFGADPLDAENTLGEFLVRTVKASAGTAFGSMEAFKDALEDQSQISEEVEPEIIQCSGSGLVRLLVLARCRALQEPALAGTGHETKPAELEGAARRLLPGSTTTSTTARRRCPSR